MKTILRKIFLSATALLLATAVHAYDFSVVNEEGLTVYYNILSTSDKTCEVAGYGAVFNEVTGWVSTKYLNIPEKVNFNSLSFTVTRIKSVRSEFLESVTIPNSITSIGPAAFMGCKKLPQVKLPDSLTSIEDSVFMECSALTSITIPSSIKTIGKRAFYNCQSLSSVVIPNSVTTIGEAAFFMCYNLTSIEIPNSVTLIQRYAFSRCIRLTSVKMSNAIICLNDGLFGGCSDLASIEIPNSVIFIGESVFASCSSLTSIRIPESVTLIGQWAFASCQKLTSIDLPNSVTALGANAFNGCWELSSVRLSNSIKSIGNSTFESCWNLTSIVIPASVTSIGDNAFKSCSHLTSVDISNSVTEIGNYAFQTCSDLLSVRLPNSLKTIKSSAFSECISLTSIDIPDSVTSIGKKVFERCKNITSVTLGSSIESIGEFAFASCNALVKVDSRIENPFRINENVFPTLVKKVGVLHVPKGRKAAYRATEGWSDFANVEDGGKYLHLTMPSGGNLHAFCHDEPLDFSSVYGLKAYIAAGIDSSTGEVLLTSVEEVPAGTGVILQGAAGSGFDILVNETSFIYSNLLRGTLSQTTVSDGYVLNGDRFERVSVPTTVAANSAYLVLPASVQADQTLALRLTSGVTDDIDAVVTDVPGGNGHWYTMQGIRLNDTPTTPGIYIRNGRKVMVR